MLTVAMFIFYLEITHGRMSYCELLVELSPDVPCVTQPLNFKSGAHSQKSQGNHGDRQSWEAFSE
jgi:hypothetical protein